MSEPASASFDERTAAYLVADGRPPVLRLIGRSKAGEADAWRALSTRDKARARRFMSAEAELTIDVLADWLGVDVDGAWSWWLSQVARLGDMRREVADMARYADNAELVRGDLVSSADLVGPGEVAERLGVQLATVHQWRHRRLMPAPVAVVTSTPIWTWSDVEEWATRTGRFELAPIDGTEVAF